MASKKWLVIGISGATCSGKSTLAKEIQKKLPNSVLLQQDNYFLPPNDPRHTKIPELNHLNWDIITSVDMERLHSDILKIINAETHEPDPKLPNRKVLLVDGFLLFAYKPIADMCDLKYFLTLNKAECWERRNKRTYDPPDVPGYFEKIVWPEYVKYESNVKEDHVLHNTVTFIDGSKDKAEIFEMVFSEIRKLLS